VETPVPLLLQDVALQVAQQGDDLPLELACQQLREVLEG
jgi:hypothetical protein